jgi:hypothetical protein
MTTSWKVAITFTLLGLVCLGSPVGCSSGSSGGGQGGLPSTYGVTACAQCILSRCSAERSACDADSSCKEAVDCVFACPPKNNHEVDERCAESCAESTSSAAVALWDCYVTYLEGDAPGCEAACDDAKGSGGASGASGGS